MMKWNIGLWGLGLVAVLVVSGCGRGEPEQQPQEIDVLMGNVEPSLYKVRGEVIDMPDEQGRVKLRHEEIPGFKNRRGEVVGMKSMVMPFPLDEGVEMGEIKKGDKVVVDFMVTWGEGQPYYITKIEKLPVNTELDYSNTETDAMKK